MNKKSVQSMLVMTVILIFAVGTAVQAGEIIYQNDISDKVVPLEVVVKTGENVIVMVDSSESMAADNKTFHKSYYDLEKEALKAGFERMPDLGYNFGIYKFTPWEVLYPMQKFDAATAADALNKLPAEPGGKTPLIEGLNELETVLKGLSGKTFVYIFSDGGYDKGTGSISPGDKTTELAKKYDVCFQVLDYATQERDRKTVSDMTRANMCSRNIPFDSYVNQPYYAIGPLYYTKWDTEVMTESETKVAGYKINNIHFEFDKSDLSMAAQEELDGVGKFLTAQPQAFVALYGYTDDTGTPEYNMELSRRRAEAAADYLQKNYNLGSDRVVANWYGEKNPIAGNDSTGGQAKNRRVELSIGGM
jgi:OmpA-OmpF porin, OOP family